MVSEKKKKEVLEIKELIEKYPVIGILDLFKMPSRQLQNIRKSLREAALIKMNKKRMIKLALESVKEKKEIQKLYDTSVKEPALIFSNIDPFRLFKKLKENKSKTYAKANDIAPNDIIIHAGPTNLMAGPVIGELQRVGIPAMIQEGKIHIRKDTVVVKKGEIISSQLANVLKKLDVQPIEIGINVFGIWENEIVYPKDVLDVSEEEYIQKIKDAHTYALNLCINVSYPNKESIRILLQKAYLNAKNLGMNTNILDKGIIEDLMKKANTEAKLLKTTLKI